MQKLLPLTLLFICGSVNAATIIYSEPGVVTAIAGLDIDGTLYNVDFEAEVYSTYGGNVDFWTTGTEALAAADAIASLFNTSIAQNCVVNNVSYVPATIDAASCEVDGSIPIPTTFSVYAVFYGDGFNAAVGDHFWDTQAVYPWSTAQTAIGREVGTAWSIVPIPAAVWLLGSGLGLLGFLRRKTLAAA